MIRGQSLFSGFVFHILFCRIFPPAGDERLRPVSRDGRPGDDRDRRPDDDRGEDLDHSDHLREQLEQQCVACRREQSGADTDLTNSSSGSKILNSKLI